MNTTQRQALADWLNILSKSIEEQEEGIAEMELRLERKKLRLAATRQEFADLSEDVDWE